MTQPGPYSTSREVPRTSHVRPIVAQGAARVPVHDLDREREVLGALLCDADAALPVVRDILRAEHFFAPAHQIMYAAALALAATGEPVGLVAVAGWLRAHGELDGTGGTPYLATLVQDVPACVGSALAAHATRIAALSAQRRAVACMHALVADGYGAAADPAAYVGRAAAALDEIAARVSPRTSAPSIAWVSTDDIFEPLPPVAWIVPELQIGPGRPTLLNAYGGGLKSLTALGLMLSAASGHAAFDQFRIPRPMVVRYWDMEQGSRATRRRIQRLAIGHDIARDELGDRLRFVSFPRFYLNQPGAEDVLARECEGVELSVFDSFRAFTPGTDENSSEVREFLDLLTRTSERTGTTFVVIHHSGKDKPDGQGDARQRPRGSSGIYDACGAVFSLSGARQEPRLVEMTKSPADAEGGEVEPFYLVVEDVAVGLNPRAGVRVVYRSAEQVRPPEKPTAKIDAVRDRIRAVLRQQPGISTRLLIPAAGVNKDIARAVLADMIDEHEVTEGPGKNGGRTYHLAGTP